MAVTVLIGGAFGIFAAVRPHHPVSRVIAMFNAVAIATPSFWLGILLLLLFAVRLVGSAVGVREVHGAIRSNR